jgi:glycine cleavage system H protein
MPIDPSNTLYYRRSRFTTRLVTHYRYAPSHYWLWEVEPGLFRVGLTKFATRMLGDFVEREIQVSPGDEVAIGQSIGWIEGFKAVSDIYCVAAGEFAGFNDALDREPNLVDRDPYDRGWLYLVRGEPAENCVDCEGYASLLNLAIDRMLAQQKQQQQNC